MADLACGTYKTYGLYLRRSLTSRDLSIRALSYMGALRTIQLSVSSGRTTGDQVFFTSTQVNHSTENTPLQGTAASAHCDSQDDELSYSLATRVLIFQSSVLAPV